MTGTGAVCSNMKAEVNITGDEITHDRNTTYVALSVGFSESGTDKRHLTLDVHCFKHNERLISERFRSTFRLHLRFGRFDR